MKLSKNELKKYSFDILLKDLNNFLNKNLSFEDVDKLENEIDEYWKQHYYDFSKYYSYEYLYIALNCFKKYSKKFALTTFESLKNEKIETILDYGAGSGYTTNLLQDLFVESKVYYFNLEKSLQNDYFLKNKHKNIKILNSDKELESMTFDLVFITELFEHAEKPLELLKKLLSVCSRFFVVSTSFKPEAYGHFQLYINNKEIWEPSKTSNYFYKEIKKDFQILNIKDWNNRLKIFERK